MPSVHRVYEKLKETGLEVLLIDIREARSAVQGEVEKRGYTLPVLLDRDASVTKAYMVWSTPTVYLINPDGYLVAGAVGPRDWDSPLGERVLKSLGE